MGLSRRRREGERDWSDMVGKGEEQTEGGLRSLGEMLGKLLVFQ